MNLIKSVVVKLIALILALIVMVAASYNSDPVALSFLDWKTPEQPVSLWMIVSFVIGIGVAMLYNLWANTQLRLVARKANKTVNRTQADMDKLKAASTQTESAAE